MTHCNGKSDLFPSLIVFDLDDCMWSPETYTLSGKYKGCIKGRVLNVESNIVTAVKFGANTLSIHPGARTALFEIHRGKYDGKCNKKYGGNMRIAIASSADTAKAVGYAHKALSVIEIVPGVTIREVVNRGWKESVVQRQGHIQIGRSGALSSNKAKSHFTIIQKEVGIPYSEMLFFDDSNWSDNCRNVEKHCKGVVAQRTPSGMQNVEWREGLNKWKNRTKSND